MAHSWQLMMTRHIRWSLSRHKPGPLAGSKTPGTQNISGKGAGSNLSQLDCKRTLGKILMPFLVFCAFGEATSGQRSLLLGGVEFVSLWSGQEAPSWVVERLAALARRLHDWPTIASPESRLTRFDRSALQPLLLPTEIPPQPADFLIARLVNGVIYDCAHPCWPWVYMLSLQAGKKN